MGVCTSGCCGHDMRSNLYELAEINTDPNSRLTLANNIINNTALIRHIKQHFKKTVSIFPHELQTKPVSEIILKLKVISGNLQPGSEILISPLGYKAGRRIKKDGMTYFGCKKRCLKSNIKVPHNEIVNDVVIKLREKGIGEYYRGQHFRISFKSNGYFIRDLGIGFGTFLKVHDPFVIQDGTLVSFGDSFLIINLLSEKTVSNITYKLKLTVYSETCNENILYFLNYC